MAIRLVLVPIVRGVVDGSPGRFGFDVFALMSHCYGAWVQQLLWQKQTYHGLGSLSTCNIRVSIPDYGLVSSIMLAAPAAKFRDVTELLILLVVLVLLVFFVDWRYVRKDVRVPE